MSVLRLNMPALDAPITSGVGKHKDPCNECALNDVCVKGCCTAHGSCMQESCYRECDDCGGGTEIRFQGKNVPAVCSKAPLRELQLQQVRKRQYKFKKWGAIKFKRPSIIVTQGSPGRVDGCPYPEGTEAVVVNLRHVWATRGWFSQDMRDYMRVPDGVKLILISSTHDDVLEYAWNMEVHHEDFKRLGFDYWQMIQFSDYASMSRYNNLWLGYRTLLSVEASKSSFCVRYPTGLDVAMLREGNPWQKLSEACPQLMVNWQYVSTRDEKSYRWMLARVKRCLKYFPAIKSVWFIGVAAPVEVYNLTRNLPHHSLYFMSVHPWIAAFKGDDFLSTGRVKKSTLPRTELVHRNQEVYHNMVGHWMKAARKKD